MLVAGVDSSTQSTKVLLCRAEDGAVVARGSAPHPGGTECDPAAWWSALQQAGDGLLSRADAIAVAGQQHGMVVLDDAGDVIRPALLWNDLRSAAAARALIAERGGPAWWAEHTGSISNASFTVTKLRWLAEHEPDHAARVTRVLLPHDWVTWRLGATAPVTDRGDAPGTGYFSPAAGEGGAAPPGRGRRARSRGAPGAGHRPRRWGRPEPGRCSRRAPATTWGRRSASAWSRESSSSPSGRPGPPTRSPWCPPRTPRAPSPGSRTRPAASFPWWQPSTQAWCCPPRPR